LTSSGVIGVLSGPGSTTIPLTVVPGTEAVLTVVKVSVKVLPGVPVPAASSNEPSVPFIWWPSTCSVTVEAPGRAWVKRSHAPISLPEVSVVGTMVAGTTAPVESVAKKLEFVSVEASTGREKMIFGRYVTPTSVAAFAGVTLAIVSVGNVARETLRVSLAVLPAASVAMMVTVWPPVPTSERSMACPR
jgi:hypothetical protein